MALPQYLSTTDPEVVATIERNEAARKDFVERAQAWAAERGFETARTFRLNALSDRPGAEYVTGLRSKPDESVFGEWTVPKNRNSSPKKTNTAECEAMKALRYEPEPLPGLPTTAQVDRLTYTSPGVFVHDGVAYAGYSDAPQSWGLNSDQELGSQWSEVLSSQWGDALAQHRED